MSHSFKIRRALVAAPAATLARMLALSLPLATCGVSLAQDFPSRPIKIIVPFAAGGPTDSQARAIALRLSDELKNPVIVENRPGGSSNIGTEMVARAKPDGYTLLFCSATLAVNPGLFDKLPYDPIRDFSPITLVSFAPTVVAVHPSLPVNDIKQLIAHLKANPGKLSFATGGNGSTQHLAGERLKLLAGIKMQHLPYKGEAPAMVDVEGGHVPIIFANVPSALPMIRAGRIKALAVTSMKRSPALPEIPTLSESGLPDFDVVAWFGVLAPAGTPPQVVDKLNAAFVKVINSGEISEKITSVGGTTAPTTPKEFSTFLNSEVPRWTKLIKDSGVTLN